MVAILGPFSAHFQTHFQLIFVYWQTNKQNGMKNDVKNGYHEHPRKEILEKWSFPFRHTAKKMKNDHFSGLFLQK